MRRHVDPFSAARRAAFFAIGVGGDPVTFGGTQNLFQLWRWVRGPDFDAAASLLELEEANARTTGVSRSEPTRNPGLRIP